MECVQRTFEKHPGGLLMSGDRSNPDNDGHKETGFHDAVEALIPLFLLTAVLVLYWQVVRAGGQFWSFRWWFETDVESVDEVYDPRSLMTWIRSLGRRDVYLFIWAVLCVAGVPFVAFGYVVCMSAMFLIISI